MGSGSTKIMFGCITSNISNSIEYVNDCKCTMYNYTEVIYYNIIAMIHRRDFFRDVIGPRMLWDITVARNWDGIELFNIFDAPRAKVLISCWLLIQYTYISYLYLIISL